MKKIDAASENAIIWPLVSSGVALSSFLRSERTYPKNTRRKTTPTKPLRPHVSSIILCAKPSLVQSNEDPKPNPTPKKNIEGSDTIVSKYCPQTIVRPSNPPMSVAPPQPSVKKEKISE